MIDQKSFYTFETMDKEFLFFPYTLTIFKIDKEVSEILSKYDNYITCNEEIVNVLKEVKNEEEIELMKSLLPYIQQEYKIRNIIKEIEKNKTLKKDIDTLQVNTSYSCNMRCKYCFAEDGSHGKSGFMKLEDIHKVYDFINKNNHKDTFKVVFVGGEPLINKKYVYEFINKEEECNANLSYIIITNGTLIDDKIVDLMKNKNLMLNISIDSNDKKINDYLRPMQGENSSYSTLIDDKFVMMEDVKEKISINCTVTKNNLHISEMFKEFYKNGFSKFHFQEVVTENSNLKIDDKDADILIDEYKKITQYLTKIVDRNETINCYPLTDGLLELEKRQPKYCKCTTMENIIAVSPDFKLYPCDMLMWDDYEIGTVEEGFNEDKIVTLNKQVREERKLCDNCWNKYMCGGLCLSEVNALSEEQKRITCKIKREISKCKIYLYTYIMENNPSYMNKFL